MFYNRKISRSDLALVRNSRLFDATYYARRYHVKVSKAAKHYCLSGWRRGYEPSEFFDSKHYCDKYPDVLAAETNPLLHYLKYGGNELRSPSPHFDPQLFLDYHAYIVSEYGTPAETCIKEYGNYAWLAKFDRASSISVDAANFFLKYFDENFYRSFNKDVDFDAIGAYEHFLRWGQFEFRNPSPAFDCYWVAKLQEIIHHPSKNIVMETFRHREQYHNLKTSRSVDLPRDPSGGLGWSGKPLCSVCIHVHCFYFDIFEEIASLLLNLENISHLIVTVTNHLDKIAVEQLLVSLVYSCKLTVMIVENRGRDVAPFLLAAAAIWRQYDVVLHLHTKLSSHADWGRDWGRYLIEQTIGSSNLVKKIQILFSQNQSLGCAYPENYYRIKPYIDAVRSDKTMTRYASILGIDREIIDANEFAAGTVAWYRTISLERVLQVIATGDMFEEEANQRDYTLAHSLERLMPMSVIASGFSSAVYSTAVRGGATS